MIESRFFRDFFVYGCLWPLFCGGVLGCLQNVGCRSGGGVLLSVAVVSCCFFWGVDVLGERLCCVFDCF